MWLVNLNPSVSHLSDCTVCFVVLCRIPKAKTLHPKPYDPGDPKLPGGSLCCSCFTFQEVSCRVRARSLHCRRNSGCCSERIKLELIDAEPCQLLGRWLRRSHVEQSLNLKLRALNAPNRSFAFFLLRSRPPPTAPLC